MVPVAVLQRDLDGHHLLAADDAVAQLTLAVIAPSPDRTVALQGHGKAIAGDQHGLGKGVGFDLVAGIELLVIGLDGQGDLTEGAALSVCDCDDGHTHSILQRSDPELVVTDLGDLHQPAVGGDRDIHIGQGRAGVEDIHAVGLLDIDVGDGDTAVVADIHR